jgi:hypothetical protein
MDSIDYSDVTAKVLDGEALRIGHLYWMRPEPPLLAERASLVAEAIPPGTMAAGITAGWVWTGMGLPEPFSLIAKASPAPSPLIRHAWRVRGISVPTDNITTLRGLQLLNVEATAADLWTCEAPDELATAQLFHLDAQPPGRRLSAVAEGRMALLESWRQAYPWATR